MCVTKIPLEEVTFHAQSFADPYGRLFKWRGDLYRAVTPGYASFVDSLLRTPLIRKLMSEGLLVETEQVPFILPPYARVLRHGAIPFPSYAEEWCPSMLKDGAIATLDLALRLAEVGLMLRDGHPWNLLYDGTRPVYVDFTSIISTNGASWWYGYEEFTRFFINPLRLMEHGHDRIARCLLPQFHGIEASEVSAFKRPSSIAPIASYRFIQKSITHIRRSIAEWSKAASDSALLTSTSGPFSLRSHLLLALREVEHITVPSVKSAGWSSVDGIDPSQQHLGEVIGRLKPSAIVVIEDSEGEALRLASKSTVPTASIYADVCAVSRDYQAAKRAQVRLLPLVMDFAVPTPARGIDEHITISAEKRLGADLVVGGKHLLERFGPPEHLRVEHLVSGLSAFSRRFAVLNVGNPARGQRTLSNHHLDWHVDVLLPALKARFRSVDVIQSFSNDAFILACER